MENLLVPSRPARCGGAELGDGEDDLGSTLVQPEHLYFDLFLCTWVTCKISLQR